MELDDLKPIFGKLDAALARQRAVNLHVVKAHRENRLRASLRPLVWAHVAQVGVGLLIAISAGKFWVEHLADPHLLVAGALVHAYAVVMIALGSRMLALLYGLDFAAPVLAIQKQMAQVRRSYVRCGLVVGLPWWLLWLPFTMLVLRMAGFDIYPYFSPAWLVTNVLVAIVGISATLWLCRSLWHPRFERADKIEAAAGNGLAKVQAFLDEIAQFEKE
jgi:hypothetical protein